MRRPAGAGLPEAHEHLGRVRVVLVQPGAELGARTRSRSRPRHALQAGQPRRGRLPGRAAPAGGDRPDGEPLRRPGAQVAAARRGVAGGYGQAEQPVAELRGVHAQRPARVGPGETPARGHEPRPVPQLPAPAPEREPARRQLVEGVGELESLDGRHVPHNASAVRGLDFRGMATRNVPVGEAGPKAEDVMLRAPRTLAPAATVADARGGLREPEGADAARGRRRQPGRRDPARRRAGRPRRRRRARRAGRRRGRPRRPGRAGGARARAARRRRRRAPARGGRGRRARRPRLLQPRARRVLRRRAPTRTAPPVIPRHRSAREPDREPRERGQQQRDRHAAPRAEQEQRRAGEHRALPRLGERRSRAAPPSRGWRRWPPARRRRGRRARARPRRSRSKCRAPSSTKANDGAKATAAASSAPPTPAGGVADRRDRVDHRARA